MNIWKLIPRMLRKRRALICLYCGHAEYYRKGDDVRELREALLAHDQECTKNPLVAEIGEWKERAEQLWQLLDDVDTADDIAKSRDNVFRGIAMNRARKRTRLAQSPDGYVLEWVTPVPDPLPDILPDPQELEAE